VVPLADAALQRADYRKKDAILAGILCETKVPVYLQSYESTGNLRMKRP